MPGTEAYPISAHGFQVMSGMRAGMRAAVGIKKKESKAEQEMALQVARMIINDVYVQTRWRNAFASEIECRSPHCTGAKSRGCDTQTRTHSWLASVHSLLSFHIYNSYRQVSRDERAHDDGQVRHRRKSGRGHSHRHGAVYKLLNVIVGCQVQRTLRYHA